MSFEERLLDGFDVLGKKTTASLEGVKNLGEFYKNLGEVLKKFGDEVQSVCSKYKAKKINTIEGAVKASVLATVTEVETTFSEPLNALGDVLLGLNKETDAFIKEHEKSRKRMLSEAANLKKDMDGQIAQLKKAKDAYHKGAKDAVAARQALENGKGNQGKVDTLDEKAKGLDEKYRDVLDRTNSKQDSYYTSEQPALLRQFQEWEENRIEFVRKQLTEFGDGAKAADMLTKWDSLMTSVTSCAEDIDVQKDIAIYVESAAAGLEPANKPFQYEPSPEGGPSVGPPPSGSSAPREAPRRSSGGAKTAPAPAAKTKKGKKGKGNDEENFIIERTDTQQQQQEDDQQQEDGGAEEADGEWYRALYSYTPANDGELEMAEGDLVYITEKDPSGWWYASKDDKEGFVPADYVEPAN